MKENEMLFSKKQLMALIIPMTIELTLNIVVGMIDAMMVSVVGEAGVSGVSLVDSVMQLLIYVFSAVSAGGAIVAGQYLGKRDNAKAKQAAGDLYWSNFLLACVIMVIVFFMQNFILTEVFGNIEADVYYHAARYMAVIIFSIPSMGMYNAAASIFRTMGKTELSMKVSLYMNVMNIIGNSILIYGFGMGTFGAALATVISRWFAGLFMTYVLLDQSRQLSLKKEFIHHFDKEITKNIFKLGIPNGIENGVFQIGKIAIISMVTAFGTSAVAANSVISSIAAFEMVPGNAISYACLTVIAQCAGREDYVQLKYYNRLLLKISMAAILVWSSILFLALQFILSFYHLSAETTALAAELFICHACGGTLLWSFAFVLPSSLRAAGDVRFPMIVAIAAMWICRFGGGYILAFECGLGVLGIWIAQCFLDWGVRTVLYLWRWKSEKWKSMKVV